jgi:hypothetical protein
MFRGARTVMGLVAAEKFHEEKLIQIAWIKADAKARGKKK